MELSSPVHLTAAEANEIRFGGLAPIAKLRSSHHQVAQCLARGMTNLEVSATTGYSPMRISQLLRDPTFAELVSSYTDITKREFTSVVQRMATLSLDALEELQSRLDEKPDDIETELLIKLATATLDRTGHAPVTKVQSTVTMLSKSDILEMKRAAQESVLLQTPLPALPGDSNA